MAARVAPGRIQAAHQSLHHLVAKADWSDDAVLAAVRARVLPLIERRGAIRGWMIDDTGIAKKGTHSVGVARQYCGQLGKQDNCQVAVTLSLANDHASLPIARRLYLPQAWADDPIRRARAGVPDAIAFQTKPQIALAQIHAALQAGLPPAPVLADAGYGVDTEFRDGITRLGLLYIVGIQSSTSLWPPGTEPLTPKPWSGRGRRTSLVRRDAPAAHRDPPDRVLEHRDRCSRSTGFSVHDPPERAFTIKRFRCPQSTGTRTMVTRFHSPRTLSRPRSRNWRNPSTDLMMPNTGSGVCLRGA